MTGAESSPARAEERERLRLAIERVRERIERACARAGRPPDSVSILAVSKTVPVGRLADAIELGIADFGENRVQEAESKIGALAGARWQMVGHLQSNKTARAVALFDGIQSVDSLSLAKRIAHAAHAEGSGSYPVFLQVNVDDDPRKEGFAPDQLTRDLPALAEIPDLQLRGLMTVGRLAATADAARPTFRALRDLAERLRSAVPRLGGELSMGMSDDFEVAIEEGATVVRLGRVLFGEREFGERQGGARQTYTRPVT